MRLWAEDCGLWVVGCGLAGWRAWGGCSWACGRSTTLAIYSIPNPLYASLLSHSLSSSSKKSRLLLLPPALFSSPDLTLFSPLSSFLLLPPPLPPSPSHARDLLPPSAADHRASLALPFLLPASPPSPIPSALLVIPTSPCLLPSLLCSRPLRCLAGRCRGFPGNLTLSPPSPPRPHLPSRSCLVPFTPGPVSVLTSLVRPCPVLGSKCADLECCTCIRRGRRASFTKVLSSLLHNHHHARHRHPRLRAGTALARSHTPPSHRRTLQSPSAHCGCPKLLTPFTNPNRTCPRPRTDEHGSHQTKADSSVLGAQAFCCSFA